MQCDECQTENPVTANFCLGCGARLRSSIVRPSAERRPMHVAFCDVVGSTQLSEQMDPEDLRLLLQDVQQICADVVNRYEGYIAQFLGDGALVYFGFPRAHEDDARRAVRAGLEIVRTVSRATIAGRTVHVRVGIHSGLVVVGEVGVPGRRTELAVGETPNVASRVQAEAEPDTVLISQATERLVRGFFQIEALGPRSLRGLRQPLSLFRVLAESGARDRLDVAKAAGLTPFVARDDEMAILKQNWEGARRGRGRVISIRGEAGVGKSRLVETFKASLADETFEVLHCPSSEYLRNTAFHPFGAALEQELRLSGTLDPARAIDRVGDHATRFGLSVPETARVLSDLLGGPSDRAVPSGEVTPAQRRQLTMTALGNWLTFVPPATPKLVVLEDVHWADASTLELIEDVATAIESRPVLLLLTFRPEFPGSFTLGHPRAVIQLHPLRRSDAAQMASYVAGGRTLPRELTSRLEEATRGVPLYIEEFTKGLLESGALVERDGALDLSTEVARGLVPETLAGPLTARIDRLASAKPIAQLASVLGLEFRRDMLAAISGLGREELSDALEKLVSAELVVQGPSPLGDAYQFRHALIRDAAYKSLLMADRREIHKRIVDALQSQFRELADNRPEIVAYHASEAGVVQLAATEWHRASEKALGRAANWEALAHIGEGVRQVEQLPEDADRFERHLTFELARGPALMAVKGFQATEVRETYLRAQELCSRLGDPRRLYPTFWGLWAHRFVGGQLDQARDFAEQVIDIATATGDPALLVPAYHALGYTMCYAGEFERTLELARAGIALFDLEIERHNVRLMQFSSTVALRQFASVALWMLGFPEQAKGEAQAAIALAEELAHPPTLAYAASALTWGAPFLTGDLEALDEAARRATELSRDERFSLWPMLVKAFRGWSIASAGAVEAGLTEMQEGHAAFRAAGGGILRVTLAALMADVQRRAGQASAALTTISHALAEIPSTGEHNYEPELHRIRGEILWSPEAGSQRSDDAAEASLRASLSLAREQRARALELRGALSLARFLGERRGRAEEGRDLVRQLYAGFSEGFETHDLREARRAISGDPASEGARSPPAADRRAP